MTLEIMFGVIGFHLKEGVKYECDPILSQYWNFVVLFQYLKRETTQKRQ